MAQAALLGCIIPEVFHQLLLASKKKNKNEGEPREH